MADDIRFAPINDGREEDCQCARCGSSCYFVDCGQCDDGEVERDEWDYCGTYFTSCDHCRGSGGWWQCCSGAEWCEANPMEGREAVDHGKVEWFTLPPRASAPIDLFFAPVAPSEEPK